MTLEELRTTRNKTVRFIIIGVYYGYSLESTIGFIKRNKALEAIEEKYGLDIFKDDTYIKYMPKGINDSEGTPFEGTGYIPTPQDIRDGYDKVTAAINKRRYCPTPAFKHNNHSFRKLLLTDDKFALDCLTNVNEAKEKEPSLFT